MRGHLSRHFVAFGGTEGDVVHCNVAHPLLVLCRVIGTPHTGEEHGESTGVFHAAGFFDFFVLVGFVGRCLFFALGAHAVFILNGTGHVSLFLRAEGFALEQGVFTILFTTHVRAEGKDVLG